MSQYRCVEDSYPFVKNEIYHGVKVFINVFGDEFPVYRLYHGEMNNFIIMPCHIFEEINN